MSLLRIYSYLDWVLVPMTFFSGCFRIVLFLSTYQDAARFSKKRFALTMTAAGFIIIYMRGKSYE